MRLQQIHASNIPPLKRFSVEQLSDTVVLAGPNGVGKTRLVAALLQFFQNPQPFGTRQLPGSIRLVIDATNQIERDGWGKSCLDTENPADSQLLTRTLQKAQKRTNWQSSVINFESDRTIQQVSPFAFTWDSADPWLESIVWNTGFTGLRNRFQDTMHSLFRKVRSRRERITERVEELARQSKLAGTVAPPDLFERLDLDFPDPIAPFKHAFSQLLAPKELVDPDPKNQQLYYVVNGEKFPISSLSSGEREVVNIVFDFLLRSPNDCIVIFDEPELHLHPELSYKLLQTLRTVGRNNQFVFCTHSPDIITASLDNTVIFLTPPKADGDNQAVCVREDDKTNQALKLLGQSVGIVALGKRLVLIEGKASSLDKQTYGAILGGRFPGFVLVPVGGKAVVTSFAGLQKEVLERTIWGVDFFMLCDHDAAPMDTPAGAIEETARLKVLKRYHLENYFLDENVLADVFADMEPDGSRLRSPIEIRKMLKEIAADRVAYTAALATSAYFRQCVGNLSIMPKDCVGKTINQLVEMLTAKLEAERSRIQEATPVAEVQQHATRLADRIQKSLDEDNDEWKQLIPGKQLLSIFASKANFDMGRLKTKYIKCAEKMERSPFQEIIEIFQAFEHVT